MAARPAFRGGFMEILYNRVRKDGPYEWADNVWSHPVLDHFRVYFRLKIWDDRTRDVEELVNEYFTQFYGPAAAAVRRFVDLEVLPGIDRLLGLFCVMGLAMGGAFAISRTRIWILFGGSIFTLLILAVVFYLAFKWALGKLMR